MIQVKLKIDLKKVKNNNIFQIKYFFYDNFYYFLNISIIF